MRVVYTAFTIILLMCSIANAQYSWQLKQAGSSAGGPIDVEKNNSNNVYFGSTGIIYKSTDRGETFSPLGTQIPGSTSIRSIILNQSNPSIFLVASSNRIVKSTNAGTSWTVVADNMSFATFGIPMTPDPSHPDTIYTMNGANFLRSTDFGDTWTTISSNFGTDGPPCDIEVFPDTSIILVGDNFTGIFKSTDYGITWTQVHNTTGEIPTIAVDFQNPGTAWATRWGGGGGLLKSLDYGSTWVLQSEFSGINMWGLHVQPTNGNVIIAGCYTCGTGTWRSVNGGQSWTTISIPPGNYRIVIVDSVTQFSAQSSGFYKLESPYFIPVELASFTAEVSENKVHLEWRTSSEINNQGFDIEMSYDNESFKKIDFVPGFGTTAEEKKYYYIVNESLSARNYFRLKQIDFDGTFSYSPVVEAEGYLPSEFSLQQNYPNPFNPATSIQFSLPVDASVRIKIFDMLGEEVAIAANNEFLAGTHNVNFIADDLSSGIYFYSLEAEGVNGKVYKGINKMILLK